MKIRNLVFATTILMMVVGLNLGQTKPSLDNLSWLSGCWEGRQGEALIEEHWSKPEGQSMLGFSRTIRNEKTVSYEFLQIREDAGGLTYLPQPQGGERVAFKLNKFDQVKYTFENAAHDFPQRIIYERQGLMLLASIEGSLKGKPERQEFLMKKVRCNEPPKQ